MTDNAAMKNKTFVRRFGFAMVGIRSAWQTEKSFRTQVAMGAGAMAVLLALRAAPMWWAIFLLCIGAVLACELLNTALERVVDRLHPENHPMIAQAKDCAAGAVLVMSIVSLSVLLALIVERIRSWV